MNPVDYRNDTWESLCHRLVEDRLTVYRALCAHGPCTTRALAVAMQREVTSVRPRITELFQLGFILVRDDLTAAEKGAVYEALSMEDALKRYQESWNAAETQLELKLKEVPAP